MYTDIGINDLDAALGLEAHVGVVEMAQGRKPGIPGGLDAFAGSKDEMAGLVVVKILAVDGVGNGVEVVGVCDDGAALLASEAEHDLGARQLGGVKEGRKDGQD